MWHPGRAHIWPKVYYLNKLGRGPQGDANRLGAKYFEKYSNTLQFLWLINDYNYITITGPVEM